MQLFGIDQHYYPEAIRRYVALFGSIFSDLHIKRESEDGTKVDFVRVPIKYGNGNMYLKAAQDETREFSKVSRILPAMAFQLDNFYKDVSRKTNGLNRIISIPTDADGKKIQQFNRVPYNFIFNLDIRTKNIDDMLQIVEQIVPQFDGNLSYTIQGIANIGQEQDIIIKLEEISIDDNYEDEMQSRLVEWKITFELKGFLYKRSESSFVVKEVDIIGVFENGQQELLSTIDNQEPITEEQQIVSDLSALLDTVSGTKPKKTTRRKRKE